MSLKRKTPLKAKTRLDRSPRPALKRTPMKRAPRKTKRADAERRDPEYMEKVRSVCCVMSMSPGPSGECYGRTHAHHAGDRPGMGIKAEDRTCVALCQKHHGELHARNGDFHPDKVKDLKEWSNGAMETTRSLIKWYEAMKAKRP